MYTIERKDKCIIVRKGEHLNAPEDSYAVFKDAGAGEQRASRLGDLPDHKLLLPLANAVDIPMQ